MFVVKTNYEIIENLADGHRDLDLMSSGHLLGLQVYEFYNKVNSRMFHALSKTDKAGVPILNRNRKGTRLKNKHI